jgi:two-component system NtrC family response regulator
VAEKKTLMIVEDDPGLQTQLRWSFDSFEVVLAEDRAGAIAHLRRYEPYVVTLDLGLASDPDGVSEGFATLEEIIALAPNTKVIVVTGKDEQENAVRAIGMGAYDFYAKPVDAEILGLIVKRAFRVFELEDENRKLAARQGQSHLQGIIATSPQMLKVCRTVEKIAPADVTTLLLGESGTGKELLARALHDLSPRASKRFVAINCAAIPETLLESELFGYEKGAFTGAAKQTFGKVEYADGGTLFLDEVGDLPLSLQAKLLRFLQERVIERVGGRKEIPVDVRVVCATHQDLPALVKEGRFREDLYYRISEITIDIPPVRARHGDAVLLAQTFLRRFNDQNKRKLRGFSKDALLAIEAYPWPGNVREMENKVKRAVIMAEGTMVNREDLELNETLDEGQSLNLNLRQVRDEAELRGLQRALSLFQGNISKAAEVLGISRPTLYDLMNKHGITTEARSQNTKD